jgi:hypothetical protein
MDRAMNDLGPNPQITLIVDGEAQIPGHQNYYQARLQRKQAFDLHHELNLLWDDINDGRFGEAAKAGKFFQYVDSIRQAIPKPPGPR